MKFYFYTNKNIMFDFLGRNIIAPDAIVKDIKQYRTIGTASDLFLFVTHKKLDRKSRERGIAEPEFVYPITLELSVLSGKDGLAVLVYECENGLEYELEAISQYNPEKHVGAYLIGEIPLSRVEKIYFDTQDEQDMFSRPSPDYWYPTNKYDLLPESFSETFTLELEEDRIVEASCLNREEIILAFRRREKQRAAIINFINGTKRWQLDRYLFNMDGSLQKLLGLKDEAIYELMPQYVEVRDKGNVEYICLVGETQEQSREFNQTIFNNAGEVLIEQAFNTQKQPEQITEILNNICEKIMAKCKSPIEANIVRQSIVEIDLNALLFVSKNPNRYELFLEALDAYHSDILTKRRASVLWGMLNGLYGMPGEGFNKDNQQLWQFIEAFVYSKEKKDPVTFAVDPPKITINKGCVLGIFLKEEQIVTAGEIRKAILATPKEKLTNAFYGKLLEAAEVEAGSKKKVEHKGYSHSVASLSLPEIKKGEELNASIRKMLEQLVKDCKTAVPNKDKLYMDFVEDESKFSFVFDIDPGYWKKAFKIVPENKNAKL